MPYTFAQHDFGSLYERHYSVSALNSDLKEVMRAHSTHSYEAAIEYCKNQLAVLDAQSRMLGDIFGSFKPGDAG